MKQKTKTMILSVVLTIFTVFASCFTTQKNVSAADLSDEAIIFDVEYTGNLVKGLDKANYTLNVPSDGTISVDCVCQSATFHIYIYDKKGISQAEIYFCDNAENRVFTLPKGDYSVVVEKSSGWTAEAVAYYFTFGFKFNSSTNAKVSSPNAGELKVTAPKANTINGFEVRYKKSGDKSWTVQTIETKKNLNKTFTGLNKGSKYKVQTRQMVTDKYGYHYYSDWTEAQSVTIKK